jgi:hypothetical protein
MKGLSLLAEELSRFMNSDARQSGSVRGLSGVTFQQSQFVFIQPAFQEEKRK